MFTFFRRQATNISLGRSRRSSSFAEARRKHVVIPIAVCASLMGSCSSEVKKEDHAAPANQSDDSYRASPSNGGGDAPASDALGLIAAVPPPSAAAVSAAQATIPSNFALIRQPETVALGASFRGAGTSVAVIDTGVNYTLADFGSCTQPGVPATCRVPVSLDFSDGKKGVAYTGITNVHGTHLASVVAALAPETKILDLKVYSQTTLLEYVTDAVNWVIANRARYNIAALNIAVSGSTYNAICDAQGGIITTLGQALTAARQAGILPVIGSGNAGQTNALAVPSCLSAAVSVGAVDNQNSVMSFSNAASFLTILAPGKDISGAGYVASETSLAAAHVAGSAAILRGLFPAESVETLLGRMRDRGVPTQDTRNGLVKPRLDLLAAVQGDTGCTVQVSPAQISAPIEGGTFNLLVQTGSHCSWTINLASSLAAFVTPQTSKGTGPQTVTLTVAPNAPTGSPRGGVLKVSIDGGSASADVIVTQAGSGSPVPCALTLVPDVVDVPVGGGTYPIRINTNGDSCGWVTRITGIDAGLIRLSAYSGTGPATIQATIVPNNTGSARSASFIVALATSTNSPSDLASVRFNQAAQDKTPPTNGKLVINGGAAWTKSTTVSVTYSAEDPSGIAKVCLSNSSTTCTQWKAAGGPISIALSRNSQNVMTVYGWFEDGVGNRTTSPVSQSIRYDATAPTVSAISSSKTSNAIALSWQPATDAASGVASYNLVYLKSTSTYPASKCTNGTKVPASSTGATITGLLANTSYRFKLCVLDAAGNSGERTVAVTTNR